jgi:L-iditol 2-dehydrogenase
MLACALARSLGASRVAAIDINQKRLDFAKKNGFAHQTYCFPPADKAKNTDEQLRRAKESASLALATLNKEDGFDVVFECSGAEPCIQMSIHVSHNPFRPNYLCEPSFFLAPLFPKTNFPVFYRP